MAVPTPRGTPTIIATAVKAAVPMMMEKMPPSRPICLGESRKKLRWRTGNPSFRVWKRIKIITPIVDSAAIQIRNLAMPWVK
jgi:hypothetical protein